jgi:hypothetical protein
MVNAGGRARLGALTVGLGIGAAVAAMPGNAWADSSTDWFSAIDTLLSGAAVPAAGSTTPLDIAISMDGVSLLQVGTAHAYSGTDGDIAMATGAGSTAYAYGTNNYADILGNNDVGWAGGYNPAGAVGSHDNTVFIDGNNDTALAGGDGNPGTFDYVAIFGSNDAGYSGGDAAGAGSYDGAYLEGDNLGTAYAQGADHLADILKFYGDPTSTAASVNLLNELLPSTGTAGDGSNLMTDLVALFDPGSAAADSGHFLTDLASLF